jgi:CrcB protein
MLKPLIALMVGGGLGAISRWGLHFLVDSKWTPHHPFPWGILLVNVIGCFLFGWLFSLFEGRTWFSDTLQLAIFTGFLGSFTTFATFGWNTLELFRTGQIALAIGNVGANVILGMVAVWLGFILAR